MNQDLKQALLEQNSHWEGTDYLHPLKRRHDSATIKKLALEEIQIITGIRRSGKSTLMKTLINHLKTTLSATSILYVNFDDPNYTLIYQDASLLRQLITTAEKLTNCKIEYIFFDEIQNVLNWEKYIKSTYDSNRFKKIVLSGSNADLLNSDYANLLSGRYIESHIYPLCFAELIMNNNINNYRELIHNKAKALQLVDYMMQFGGFPRIYCIKDNELRVQLLQSYYETLLLKDCIANNSVRDTKTLMNLAYYLLSNIGGLYSYNSLSKVQESNENTIKDFIQLFQNAYFIHEIKNFSYSLKAQAKANKKPYALDNGIITAINFKFSQNSGKLFENLVFSELRKAHENEIFYYNTNKECDFILHTPQNLQAIQVCYDLTPANRDRELQGLNVAMQSLTISKGLLITYDHAEKISEHIEIIPFWQYFSGLMP